MNQKSESRRVDQTRRGLFALLLVWPALLFVQLTGVFRDFGRRLPRLRSKPLRELGEAPIPFIERYSFAVNDKVKLGESQSVLMQGAPRIMLDADRIFVNAPCPGFLILDEISIDGTNVFVGKQTDAFVFSPLMFANERMTLPRMSPKSRVVVKGQYTGHVPPGFAADAAYLFSVSFQGSATYLSDKEVA
jgi:hypothetical protein